MKYLFRYTRHVVLGPCHIKITSYRELELGGEKPPRKLLSTILEKANRSQGRDAKPRAGWNLSGR
jgi:hypothetical protein